MFSSMSIRLFIRRTVAILATIFVVGYLLAFLLILILEGATRLFWALPSGENYNLFPHPIRLWTLPNNGEMRTERAVAKINEIGLRSVETHGSPHRILTLGDSNIFGFDLREEETLHVRIQEEFKAFEIDVDVICGGVPGYSSMQSRILMNEVGWDLLPDLLILGSLLSDSSPAKTPDALRTPSSKWLYSSRALMWLSFLFHKHEYIEWWETGGTTVRVSPQEYRENIEYLLKTAASKNIGALILQPVTQGRFLGRHEAWQWLNIQRELAQKWNIPVIDAKDSLIENNIQASSAFLDLVHVSPLGSAAQAKSIAKMLNEKGWPQNRLIPSL
jgi:hypothetical protein